MKQAIRIACMFNVTVYDSIYVALAKDLKYDFITADEKLYKKVRSLSFVKLLKDWKG